MVFLGGGNSYIFYFHHENCWRFPFWLINIFKTGWNHQLVFDHIDMIYCRPFHSPPAIWFESHLDRLNITTIKTLQSTYSLNSSSKLFRAFKTYNHWKKTSQRKPLMKPVVLQRGTKEHQTKNIKNKNTTPLFPRVLLLDFVKFSGCEAKFGPNGNAQCWVGVPWVSSKPMKSEEKRL